MKILYLDCGMGAAGDMLTAALLGLHPQADDFLRRFNLALGGRALLRAEKAEKCGIQALHMRVIIDGDEEGVTEQHHHHASVNEMYGLIDETALPEKVREDAKNVFRLVAQAESQVHGMELENVHFHELGSLDAAADILAVCALMNELAPDRICVSPVSTGSGFVHCAHGVLPVPAPATEILLRGIPISSGGIESELCTPTGAALIKYFAHEFGDMPDMRLIKSGMGAGRKDFPKANIIRAMLGSSEEAPDDKVTELCCNLDDMSPEALGFAMEELFAAGALDVYFINIGMKKCRPGVMLCCMCRQAQREDMLRCIFKNTSTLGVREYSAKRYTLQRSIRSEDTPYGKIRIKTASGWGVERQKAEYEDLARAARENKLSLDEMSEKIK